MKFFTIITLLTLFLWADGVELIKPDRVRIVDFDQCRSEVCVKKSVDVDLTNIEWLDSILLENMMDKKAPQLNNKEKIDYLRLASLRMVEIDFLESQGSSTNYELIDSEIFLYQRYDLATFKRYSYSYTGGAHGMLSVLYNVVDMQEKRILTLDDIVSFKNREKLASKLLEVYKIEHEEYIDTFLPKRLKERLDYIMVDNFYFKEYSIVFVYDPYHIGPFSDGAMEIELFFDELKDICLPKYIKKIST